MKKFLVIGDPINHSLSPKLHNYWINKSKINAIYEKKNVKKDELKTIIQMIKQSKLQGANITVPYKQEITKYVDMLTHEASQTKSVNTLYKQSEKIIGHNTDIAGFELAIRQLNFDMANKKILIIGAGGVVSSIVFALIKLKPLEIYIMNRTEKKAEMIKEIFKEIKLVEWGKILDYDMIINATSVGLSNSEDLNLNFKDLRPNKFFYDVIYNPPETNFLRKAKELNHKIENGKMMFIYQAHQAFTLWHNLMPTIDDKVKELI